MKILLTKNYLYSYKISMLTVIKKHTENDIQVVEFSSDVSQLLI